MNFHKIKFVKPLENMVLEVVFESGEKKKYDMKILFKKMRPLSI